jgi:hypothetical protein
MFQGCSNLAIIHAGDLLSQSVIERSFFNGCSNLTKVVMPSVKQVNYQCMNNCNLLEVVDIGQTAGPNGNIAAGAFGRCDRLTTLILRRGTMLALANVNAFANTPFKDGGTGGEIYVPSALIDTYKAAAQWSILDGYGTVTWKAIEGSIYEHAYADGTPIT